MIHTVGRKRFDALDGAIASGLVLLFLGACSSDSTSPTPTATSIVVASGASQTATVATSLAIAGRRESHRPVGQSRRGSQRDVRAVGVSGIGLSRAGDDRRDWLGVRDMDARHRRWSRLDDGDDGHAHAGRGGRDRNARRADALTIVAGNNQSAPIDSTLASTLEVKVTDQYGNVVPNATVQWSDDAGGTLSATTTVTDANGIAQVQYTLGPNAGPEDVVATLMVGSVPMTTSFVEIGN